MFQVPPDSSIWPSTSVAPLTCLVAVPSKQQLSRWKMGLRWPPVVPQWTGTRGRRRAVPVLGLKVGHLIYAKGNEDPARHSVRGADVEIICHALELDQPPARRC